MTDVAAVLDALPFEAALLDHDLRIVHANDAFARLLGHPAGELAGTRLPEGAGGAGHPELSTQEPDRSARRFPLRVASGKTRLALLHATKGRGGIRYLCLVEGERASRGSDAPPDSLARRVAEARHAINNSLMTVVGIGELVLARPDLPEAIQAKIRAILTEAERIRDRLEELRAPRGPS